MPLRISHKLSRLIYFPRFVLMELAALRQAQTRLEEAQARASGQLDNFFRMSLQNQDARGDLIVSIKRQIDDLEAVLQELKQKSLESKQ
jgi:hypothetical protein